jgi:hypothetical protein
MKPMLSGLAVGCTFCGVVFALAGMRGAATIELAIAGIFALLFIGTAGVSR